MKVLQIASKLRQMGYKVEILFRKEGGARISRIGKTHFIGSAGNKEARKLLGVELSEAQQKHLEKIKQRKGVFGKKKKSPIPKEFLNEQRKINREFKKNNLDAKVTASKIRYRLEHEGEAETRKYLKHTLQYAKKYTYSESLEAYIQRLELDLALVPGNEIQLIQSIINKTESIILNNKNLKETDFQELLSLTYEWEKSISMGLNMITTQTFKKGAIKILNRAE